MSKQFSWSAETASARLTEIENRISSKDPALSGVFTQTFFEEAHQQTSQIKSIHGSPLSGALISVKDLFDVSGFVTKAGTLFMAEDPPAKTDAIPIKQLRDAGAIFVGHANMTELAYSGLGLNPHYGTPENALMPGCIPGGSTSGGAVSVAQGIADIAIGTDTGGSLRIPAAFNGIVGFKPSQQTVSRQGCKNLSRSLDSVGPMANTVAACKLAYETMSNGLCHSGLAVDKTFIIPTNYGMDDLQAPVADAFDAAIAKISASGFFVEKKPVDVLETLKSLAIWHFASIESRGDYEDAYQTKRDMMDPRVAGPIRMGRADEVDAVTYRRTLNLRQELIEQYRDEMGSKILLMPTTPILPPTFSSLESDDEYNRLNFQVLRNPTVANIMDCCSISLPYTSDEATIGVMLTAGNNHDLSLLEVATSCESALA